MKAFNLTSCKFFIGLTYTLDAREVVKRADGSVAGFTSGPANGQASLVNKSKSAFPNKTYVD